MKALCIALLVVCTGPAARSQNAPPQNAPPQNASPQSAPPRAWSPANSIGLFAYPKNNQSPDQQLKDESDCYGSAQQNTGINPQAPAPQGPSAQQQQAAQQQAAQQA